MHLSRAGLILLSALDLANEHRSKVTVVVEERTLPIRTMTDALTRGFFPPPTTPESNFEATVSLNFKRRLRSNQIDLALTDVAGETLGEVLDSFAGGEFNVPDVQRLRDVNRFVLDEPAAAIAGVR